jgi:hypothetical protein
MKQAFNILNLFNLFNNENAAESDILFLENGISLGKVSMEICILFYKEKNI